MVRALRCPLLLRLSGWNGSRAGLFAHGGGSNRGAGGVGGNAARRGCSRADACPARARPAAYYTERCYRPCPPRRNTVGGAQRERSAGAAGLRDREHHPAALRLSWGAARRLLFPDSGRNRPAPLVRISSRKAHDLPGRARRSRTRSEQERGAAGASRGAARRNDRPLAVGVAAQARRALRSRSGLCRPVRMGRRFLDRDQAWRRIPACVREVL